MDEEVLNEMKEKDEENSKALDLINSAYSDDDDLMEYEVYYTGTYDAEKKDENDKAKLLAKIAKKSNV